MGGDVFQMYPRARGGGVLAGTNGPGSPEGPLLMRQALRFTRIIVLISGKWHQ